MKRQVTAYRGYFVAEARNIVPHLYDLPIGDVEACRTKVREILLVDSFLYKEVPVGDSSHEFNLSGRNYPNSCGLMCPQREKYREE